MSFADSLKSRAKVAEEADREKYQRQTLAENWRKFEERILDEAVRVFKSRCIREAERARSQATVSFENISRELAGFPKHKKDGRQYYVHTWGDSSQEEWHYAKQGAKNLYVAGARTPASELLASLIGRFVEKVDAVGYAECARVPGTWRVAVAWKFDGDADEDVDEDSSEQDQDMQGDLEKKLEEATEEKKEEEATEEKKEDEAMGQTTEKETAEEKKEEEATEEKKAPDAEQEDKATTENEDEKGDDEKAQEEKSSGEKGADASAAEKKAAEKKVDEFGLTDDENDDEKGADEDERGEDDEKKGKDKDEPKDEHKESEAKASQDNPKDANDAAKLAGEAAKAGAANGHGTPAVRSASQRRAQRREAKLDAADFIRVLQRSTRKAKKARGERDSLVDNWNSCQEGLLSKAVDAFKVRCEQEAELGRTEAQISFEALSRDLTGFPTRKREGEKYHVESWGDSTAECWHYATKGVDVDWLEGPVAFPELLDGMLGSFVDKANKLGFPSCKLVPGSWKVAVRWDGDAGGVFNPESGFVRSLRTRSQLASKVMRQRKKAAAKYKGWEDQIFAKVMDILKETCKKEAALRKRSTNASFEVLTRDLAGFPTRVRNGEMYLVDSWGTCSAENWFYATHGTEQAFVATKPVVFSELLQSMMPRFVARVSELGFDSCERVPRSWKVAVRWAQDGVALEQEKSLSFGIAAGLRAKVKEADKAMAKREKLAARWTKFEERLLSKAVKVLKKRCLKDAENGKRDAIVSFEAITREVEGFPQHEKREGNHVVASWGKSSIEEWFYGNQGIVEAFDKSSPPVLSAELLAGMMGRFLEKAGDLGFSSVERSPGTWKIVVRWDTEGGDDKGAKQAAEGEAGEDRGTKRAAEGEEFWPDGTKKRRVDR